MEGQHIDAGLFQKKDAGIGSSKEGAGGGHSSGDRHGSHGGDVSKGGPKEGGGEKSPDKMTGPAPDFDDFQAAQKQETHEFQRESQQEERTPEKDELKELPKTFQSNKDLKPEAIFGERPRVFEVFDKPPSPLAEGANRDSFGSHMGERESNLEHGKEDGFSINRRGSTDRGENEKTK